MVVMVMGQRTITLSIGARLCEGMQRCPPPAQLKISTIFRTVTPNKGNTGTSVSKHKYGFKGIFPQQIWPQCPGSTLDPTAPPPTFSVFTQPTPHHNTHHTPNTTLSPQHNTPHQTTTHHTPHHSAITVTTTLLQCNWKKVKQMQPHHLTERTHVPWRLCVIEECIKRKLLIFRQGSNIDWQCQSEETLPEAQRTQGIESLTWAISPAK